MNAGQGLDIEALVEGVARWPSGLQSAEMFGICAWWSIRVDLAELQRREGNGHVAQLRRLEVAAVLLELPMGLPVPEESMDVRQLRVLNSLPHCVAERAEGTVTRRASPPIAVDHVVMPTLNFRRGLESVTEFSTYCATSILVPPTMELCDIDFAEASFYGVGIYRADADAVAELIEPEPLPLWPETPASWTFAEMLWEKVD
jgi:hypothetical protein